MNYYEKIETNSKASAAKKNKKEIIGIYLLDYSFDLNKLNQNFNPSDGYKINIFLKNYLYSEDYTLNNRFNIINIIKTQKTYLLLGFLAASANSISNDDARITERVFIPSRKLRGFEPGKIGPKDGR